MSSSRSNSVIRCIRQLAQENRALDLPDSDLLQRFIEGRDEAVQLQGEVAAKLTGVFGKVADIGGGANGTLTREEFQGLSEEAVAAALEKSANCRERVYNKLIDKIPLDSLNSASSETCMRWH